MGQNLTYVVHSSEAKRQKIEEEELERDNMHIPEDILRTLLTFLSVKEVLAVSTVSKSFRKLVLVYVQENIAHLSLFKYQRPRFPDNCSKSSLLFRWTVLRQRSGQYFDVKAFCRDERFESRYLEDLLMYFNESKGIEYQILKQIVSSISNKHEEFDTRQIVDFVFLRRYSDGIFFLFTSSGRVCGYPLSHPQHTYIDNYCSFSSKVPVFEVALGVSFALFLTVAGKVYRSDFFDRKEPNLVPELQDLTCIAV